MTFTFFPLMLISHRVESSLTAESFDSVLPTIARLGVGLFLLQQFHSIQHFFSPFSLFFNECRCRLFQECFLFLPGVPPWSNATKTILLEGFSFSIFLLEVGRTPSQSIFGTIIFFLSCTQLRKLPPERPNDRLPPAALMFLNLRPAIMQGPLVFCSWPGHDLSSSSF